MGPSDRWPGRPAAVRPVGRGAGTHRRDRRLRPPVGLPAGAPVAGAGPLDPWPGHEREPLTGPAHGPRPGRTHQRPRRGDASSIPVRSFWRSPRARCWPTTRRRCATWSSCGRPACVSHSTTSGRAIRPCRISTGCRSTSSRSTSRSFRHWGRRRRLARPGGRHGAVGAHARLRDDRRRRGEPDSRECAPVAGLPFRPGLSPRSPAQRGVHRPPAQVGEHARPGGRNRRERLSPDQASRERTSAANSTERSAASAPSSGGTGDIVRMMTSVKPSSPKTESCSATLSGSP